MNELVYRDIRATYTFNEQECIWQGSTTSIAPDVLIFDGEDEDRLAMNFREMVDSYLARNNNNEKGQHEESTLSGSAGSSVHLTER